MIAIAQTIMWLIRLSIIIVIDCFFIIISPIFIIVYYCLVIMCLTGNNILKNVNDSVIKDITKLINLNKEWLSPK